LINEHRQKIIVKILDTAVASRGATITKLINKSDLTEYPDKLKMYLSILEDNRLIASNKGGVYRTTYKGMYFLRTYHHIMDLLGNSERE
jgi:predicted transcriptional regulator